MNSPARTAVVALRSYGGAAVRATGAAVIATLVAALGWMALVAHVTAAGGEMAGGAIGGDSGVLAAVGAAERVGGGAAGDGKTAVSLGQPTMPLRHADARLADALADEPAVLDVLVEAAQDHDVDPRLVVAVAWHESRWDPSARSNANAVGMMQVQPATMTRVASEIGRSLRPTDPADNATAGVVYLSWLQESFEDTRTALIAYNQGSRALRENGPYPSAVRYAEAVLETRSHLEGADWTPSSGSQ